MQPVLKMKVNELFARWLSSDDVRRSLKELLHQIQNSDDDATGGEEGSPDCDGNMEDDAAMLSANGSSSDFGRTSLTSSPRYRCCRR
ncbi:unnamed protein product [Lampetra fluviatilis]